LYLRIDADALEWLAKHLQKVNNPEPPGEAFAHLFREVWAGVPLAVRRRLLAYWRSEKVCPRIALTVGELTMRGQNLTSAACEPNGFALWFSPLFDLQASCGVEKMARHVRSTIAHELAHVFQREKDFETCVMAEADQQLYDRLEEEADALATAWGYPPEFEAAKVNLAANERAMRRLRRTGG
jgi:hypothetical protein